MPLLVLLAFFVVMYMLMIRPQQRRAREHQALVASVHVGDEVMTTAGIFGTVTAVDDTAVSLEVSPGVVMRVARAAIGQRMGPEPVDDDETIDLDAPPEALGPADTTLSEPEARPEPEASTEPHPEPPAEPRRDSPWGDWGQSGSPGAGS